MSKGLHRFAVLVACAAFFLIIAGANVTSHDAGLAVPDWPLSFGKVFPQMVGNVFWEHGHRMVATAVGLLTIAFNLYIWEIDVRFAGLLKRVFGRVGAEHHYRRERRSWMRWFAFSALATVIAQGLLGGLTVKLLLPLAVSAAHATLAQLFFCTTVSLAVFTSPGWIKDRPTIEEQGSLAVRYVCAAAAVTIFLQLVIGATLRHSSTWDEPLPTDLLLTHVGGAIAVTILLGSAALMILRRHRSETLLVRPAK